MTNYIAPISWGLGDLIVSLPAIQSLIDTGEPTVLVVRHELQAGLSSRIDGVAGEVSESALKNRDLRIGDRYFNLREHPLQTDYFWGSPEFSDKFPKHRINDILSIICTDLGLNCDFSRLARLSCKIDNRLADSILLIPGSDGMYKWWPAEKWIALNQYLNRQGISTFVVGQPDNCQAVSELVSSGLPWFETPSLADAVDAISSAKGVVAVDTGLMHLAVHQGIPTVALYRPEPIYYRPYDHVTALSAKTCATECLNMLYGSTINQVTEFTDFIPKSWECSRMLAERCMASIDVSAVIEALARLQLVNRSASQIPAPSGDH